MFDKFDYFNRGYIFGVKTDKYKPYINYDWSTTTASGLRYLKDVGSTPTYNASMYFGRGAYFNGVDQYISITPINLSGDFTIKIDLQNANALINRTVVGSILNTDYIKFNGSDIITKIGGVYRSSPMRSVPIVGTKYCFIVERLNGTVSMWLNDDKLITSFTENSNLILDSIGGSGRGAHFNGVFKDLFIFNRTLTQSEITQSYEQPEAFYAMAQADSTCVLNMPMCETSSTVRNYKTGIDYPITNYTTSVRDNAKNLQYGLQTCKFVRDSLGMIQTASDYLECDGVGYANTGWIPDINKDETLEIIFDSSKDAIELNGCEFVKGFGVGSHEGTPNRAYVKVHGSATKTFSTLTAISLLTIPYNATTQTFDIYSNDVLLYENIAITAIDNTIKTFKIGNRDGVFPVTTPIRLFKVHNKELTQAEITANYNSYRAKGLLS